MRTLRGKVGSLLWLLLKFIGPAGLRWSNLVSIHFTGRPSPGPRRNDLANYWAQGLSRGLLAFQWTRGISVPHKPQSLGWFWNKRPKDSRSSLQFLILIRNVLKISLSSRCFWTLSDTVKRSSVVFFCHYSSAFALFLRNRCSVSGLCFRDQHSALWNSGFIGCTKGAPNGCSPRASSGLLKIIYSKVFISSLLRNYFYLQLML